MKHYRSEFDIMLKVAELGLLKQNEQELKVIDAYMKAWSIYTDGDYIINDHEILGANYVGPGKLGEYEDMTFDVLIDIYGTDEDFEKYYG